ncbi:SNF2-related domain [Popillia japonica]|uniref:DNA repair and recombination protein RAD54-like n=1 Tax=Popillia japonica TaxID=7064 RepID=A0AAW1LDI3_POPJA
MVENKPILHSEINSINELKEIEGINVWGQDQSVLEGQALTEIEIFNNDGKEPGELSPDNSQNSIQSIEGILDIDKYIRQQEEFKKKVDFKRASSVSEKNENKQFNESGSEYFPSDPDSDDSDYKFDRRVSDNIKLKKNCEKICGTDRVNDDGNIGFYNDRLNAYYDSLIKEDPDSNVDNEEIEICCGLKISSKIWDNLYSYQQDGVRWLYELHVKSTGGLLGDEMGLGKTIQMIAFLYGLRQSRVISKFCRYTGLGPTIIVCPTTVIHQWVQHFHEWAPEFRVAVLHQSGSYTGNKTALIKEIFKDKGIMVTSYQGILTFKAVLIEFDWHYIILDEGHKIRNSEAKISKAVKQFRTPHRIMLTGSPMQNNLQELWSLFDFICPGLLGTLQIFTEHFSIPIMQGGYSNATPIQEATALLMATSLKNLITPYLLRRSKDEVNKIICLPQKSEQVLFCSLTDEQYDLYKGFLMSDHVNQLLGKGGRNWFSENHTRANVLVAITTLRKICNHPDLYLELTDEGETKDGSIENSMGYYKKSGKMVVVSALLKIWKKQKHRVLLFTQTRAMVSVLENFLIHEGYKYLKMDGSTTVRSRQGLIKTFNEDKAYDVFLLTTRVGGLGVNLTGADRVIIYDPDWNPATDTQARERAWRIGQERQVTIYRLVSAGTIEEKMYQRQVWKQLLSNKILLDPKAQKFFKTSDLHDLFSIQDRESTANPETANIFKNSRISMQERMKEKAAKKKKRKEKNNSDSDFSFSEDKIEQMKKLAQEISKRITETKSDPPKTVKKSSFEIELEEEKEARKAEREYMKSLTPQELMEYNRKKLLTKGDSLINKVDGIETEASFSKALEISEETSGIYHKIKEDKLEVDKAIEKYNSLTKPIKKKEVKSKNRRNKVKNRYEEDNPRLVDGEEVEFVVKKEINSKKGSDKATLSQKQDQYVLERLFSKKNVQVALEHDVIVDAKKPVENRCKIQYEAQTRSDLAMLALRKSRLNDWRW